MNLPAPGTEESCPITIPRGRVSVFDLPVGLMDLAAAGGIHRLRYADGHLGWIVTDFELCRQVLTRPEFSSRPDLRHSAVHEAIGDGQPPEEMPGMFVGMDPPEHTRYRRIVAAALRLAEVQKLQATIEAQAAALLDSCTGELDLVASLASPLPALVITELLGVEESVSASLTGALEQMLSLQSSAETVREKFGEIFSSLSDVVARRAQDHGPGLVTSLIETEELTETEITSVCFQLFTAGHETTTNMIALSFLYLLQNPEAAYTISGSPRRVSDAVEEFLRYFAIIQYGISRAATEHITLAGTTIAPGETITVSLPAANFDNNRFPDATQIDLTRGDKGHLAFGFGVHQCVAQQLARVEINAALHVFLQRYDELSLTSYEMKSDTIVHGLSSLSVLRTPNGGRQR
ncbi:cytochrome P450 [Mycobacteroides abscessus]|uniref:cytochrome P450 n=1 Tax=Mycobacteroides abscessus TaxID=36809 RepID=UPI0019D185B4|nr:cytochrome P450 [Mycobacteroides abscessus]MBN7558006.1 cytochrome P450 [Mycobacteroides abscessus subsp. abscessus]